MEILYHPLTLVRGFIKFPPVTMPSNVLNYSSKGGTSITEPNPDTTEYHEDEAEMICKMVMQ
jgi:hypothetical protein